MRLLVPAATFAVLLALAVGGGSAANAGPATPTNLEVIGVTETSITIAWGPSQPGPFTFLGSPKKNQVKVGWGASEDSRSATITYQFKKDSAVVATGLTQPSYTVSVGAKTSSFRMCVTAFNSRAQASPETCGTMTRG